MSNPLPVPTDADDTWAPPGYEPGPDDPGPITEVHVVGDNDIEESE